VISGIVNNRRATVNVIFILPNQPSLSIGFVIDTGFTGYLCLPPEAVNLLNLSFIHNLPINLADNTEVIVSVHSAIIMWNGEERDITVLATGRRPLLGTALLNEEFGVIQLIKH
jgi:clan AA aspartic protease